MKPVGKPDARNEHVRFDERGWETGRRLASAPAPILDSTNPTPTMRFNFPNCRRSTRNGDPSTSATSLGPYTTKFVTRRLRGLISLNAAPEGMAGRDTESDRLVIKSRRMLDINVDNEQQPRVLALRMRLSRRRINIALGGLLMGFGIVLFMTAEPLARLFNLGFVITQLTSGASFLIGLGSLLMSYLRGDFTTFKVDRLEIGAGGGEAERELDNSIDLLKSEVARLKSDFAALKSDKNLGRSIDDINNLRETLTTEITAEIERRMSSDAMTKAQLQEIRAGFANAYARLAKALEEISRRGNLNLIIGGITTGVGASSLGYMAYTAPASADLKIALSHYIPRLSTVVFLEVFAFFFLRLYKTTLADSKFYQVELLSLATTDIALQAAMKSGDSAVMSAVIGQIAAGKGTAPVPPETDAKQADIDVKGFAEVVGKFGKLVLDATKTKN
jgi:hypothetical protein